MNKQIEEMAKDLAESIVWDDEDILTIDCYRTARMLSDKYRKSTDVAREIFEEIEKFLKSQEALSENKRLKEVGDWIFHDYLPSRLADLKKKYESEGANR